MRSVIFGALAAVVAAATLLTAGPAQAMAIPAPAGLKAAAEQTNLTETVGCWDCGPRYYRPYRRYYHGYHSHYRPYRHYSYRYRPYYRTYSYGYRPYYRTYSNSYRHYRPHYHRPYYQSYSYGYRPAYRVIYGPDGPGYYDPRNVGW